MNARDLASKLAERENLTQREADAAVKLIFRLFSDAMKKVTGSRSGDLAALKCGNIRPIQGGTPKQGKRSR